MIRRRFRVRALLLAWSTYWLALIAIGLSPAIAAIWRMSRLPDAPGSVAMNVGNRVVTASVLQNGVTTWKGSMSVLGLTLLIALPPLAMWAVSLAGSRTKNAGETIRRERSNARELAAGDPGTGIVGHSSSIRKRKSREGA